MLPTLLLSSVMFRVIKTHDFRTNASRKSLRTGRKRDERGMGGSSKSDPVGCVIH